MKTTDILVKNVDIDLLRDQRDVLNRLLDFPVIDEDGLIKVNQNHLLGLVNLLDYMLDVVEGY